MKNNNNLCKFGKLSQYKLPGVYYFVCIDYTLFKAGEDRVFFMNYHTDDGLVLKSTIV